MSHIYIGTDLGIGKNKGTVAAISIGDDLKFVTLDYPDGHILQRLVSYREGLGECLRNELAQFSSDDIPIFVAIEKPPYNLKGAAVNLIPLYFFLLEAMFQCSSRCTVYEVAPSSLKKFVAGKGNASKEHTSQMAQHHWGQELPDDYRLPNHILSSDEGDALGLLRIAQCVQSNDDSKWTKYQIDVAQGLDPLSISLSKICDETG